MITKSDIINKINYGKLTHLNWLSNAEKFYNCINTNDQITSVSYSDCKFGQWLVKQGKFLNKIDQGQNIIVCYINVYMKYSEIIEFLNKQTPSNIISRSKFMKKKQKVLKEKLNSFKALSNILLEALDIILGKISIMSIVQINVFFSYFYLSYN